MDNGAAKRAKERAAKRRALMHMKHRKLAPAWRAWAEQVLNGERERALLRHALRFMRQRGLAPPYDMVLPLLERMCDHCASESRTLAMRKRRALLVLCAIRPHYS